MTNSKSEPSEVFGSQAVDNVLDTLLARTGSILVEFHFAEQEIFIVVADEEIFCGVKFIKVHKLFDGGAGEVHEGEWLCKNEFRVKS